MEWMTESSPFWPADDPLSLNRRLPGERSRESQTTRSCDGSAPVSRSGFAHGPTRVVHECKGLHEVQGVTRVQPLAQEVGMEEFLLEVDAQA